jgi:hypothetical protein
MPSPGFNNRPYPSDAGIAHSFQGVASMDLKSQVQQFFNDIRELASFIGIVASIYADYMNKSLHLPRN